MDSVPRPVTYEQVIALLADFLDQVLASHVGEALEAHLQGCGPCQVYLRTYAKTRWLVGGLGLPEMPPELKARLREFLLQQLGGRVR